MSKKITIAFKNIRQLWNYAQKINARNIEIISADITLICDCSETDLFLLPDYDGEVIEESKPVKHQKTHNQN